MDLRDEDDLKVEQEDLSEDESFVFRNLVHTFGSIDDPRVQKIMRGWKDESESHERTIHSFCKDFPHSKWTVYGLEDSDYQICRDWIESLVEEDKIEEVATNPAQVICLIL
jgi:hypothetical protein